MLRLCARTPRYYTRHGAIFVRNVHLQLPYPVEGGLGDFLPPAALKVVAVDYQGVLLQRLNDEIRRTEYAGKGIVDTVLHSIRAAALVEVDAYEPAVLPSETVEEEAEDEDVREPDHVSLSKWSTLILNNHFFLMNLKPLEGDARHHQDKMDHALLSRIDEDYGSVGQLKSTLSAASLGVFSGGHVWLVSNRKGHLAVVPTFGHGSALIRGRRYMGPPINDPSDPMPRPLGRETRQSLEEEYAAEMEELQSLLKEKPLPEDVASKFPDISQLFGEAPRLLAQRDAWMLADPEWRINIQDVMDMIEEKQNAVDAGAYDELDEVEADDESDNTEVETGDQPATAGGGPVDVYDEPKEVKQQRVVPSRQNLRFMDPLKHERLLQVETLIKAAEAAVYDTQDDALPSPPPVSSSDPKPLGAPREFHTSASRAIVGPVTLLEKFQQKPQTPYDAALNPDDHKTDSESAEDSSDYFTDPDAVVWPLFCVPVHEHAWLSAGYGVWGQEKWMKKFWSVLDWEKVSARYHQVMAEPDPDVDPAEDAETSPELESLLAHPAFTRQAFGPLRHMTGEIERQPDVLENMTPAEREDYEEMMNLGDEVGDPSLFLPRLP